MIEPQNDNSRKFEESIDLAIKAGLVAAESLQTTFHKVDKQINGAIDLVAPFKNEPFEGDEKMAGMAQVFVDQLKKRSKEMHDVFKRQRAALGTVNLALFGRTGAGKSSLIEAMSRGNGATVSPGESDWTTSVRQVEWKGCRLLDTPGTNGWGGREDRSILEGHARSAVETADVVLLCFDSQSQQQPEFQKVAEWIRSFGKPAIAVLNCRNSRWRLPPRVSSMSARRTVSEQVRQHEGNIRDELTKLGLANVPVVAISSKRALMARGDEPFLGPDALTFQKQRQEFGKEKLLQWSNEEILEQLLANSLLRDARGIRLGMLVANVKGQIEELNRELTVLKKDARDVAKVRDSTIDGLLRTLGYPNDQDSSALFMDPTLGLDLLGELERLRGGRFDLPGEGEFQVFCEQLLSSRFAALRSRSLAQAEELVLSASNNGKSVDAEQFKRQVYNIAKIENMAKVVLDEAGEFLQRKVKLALRDGQTDLACIIQAASKINGDAGKGWRWTGRASRGAGILSGAAIATVLGLAAANVWNPGGWVLAVVGIGGAISSWFFGWGGRAAERAAEQKRTKARREALSSASQHVHDTYASMVSHIADAASVTGRKTMTAVLTPILREAIVANRIVVATRMASKGVASLANALPKRMPQQIILDAARQMEELHQIGQSSRRLWLGEDWIDDPEGLIESNEALAGMVSTKAPSVLDRISYGVREVFSTKSRNLKPGDGAEWLMLANRKLSAIPGAVDSLAQSHRFLEARRPRVALVGDYNTGKSSFIKRLLVEAGATVPDKLEIRANPTTQSIHEYEWEGLVLVDSPGLQSGREGDDEAALESLYDASHLICLFQPNILGSTVERLAPLLRGDPSRGLPPKLGRLLLVLNRSDDLGVDPADDPDEFDLLAQRKKVEIVKAFARRGVDVLENRILFMASDPFGLVGDRAKVEATCYDACRNWDGFRPFIGTIKELRPEDVILGADIAAIEGGMARLGALRTSRIRQLEVVRSELAFKRRLFQMLEVSASEASRIRNHIEARLDSLLAQVTQAHIQDAMGAVSDDEILEEAKALAKWWKSESFKKTIERWEKGSRTEIDRWFKRTMKDVGRRLQSKEFHLVFPEAFSIFDPKGLKSKRSNKGAWWKIVQSVGEAGAQRTVVYDVAKFFGTKFRPWGAVKIATKVGKIGPFLAGLGVVLDGWDWYQAAKSTKEREKARKDAVQFLHTSSHEVRSSLLTGSKRALGPCGYLEHVKAEITRLRDTIGIEIGVSESNEQLGITEITALTDVLAEARKKLDLLPEESTNA